MNVLDNLNHVILETQRQLRDHTVTAEPASMIERTRFAPQPRLIRIIGEMVKDGMTVEAIADYLGMHTARVHRIYKKHYGNLPGYERWTDAKMQEVERMRADGKTWQQVAEYFGLEDRQSPADAYKRYKKRKEKAMAQR